jgi:hypothetical protein
MNDLSVRGVYRRYLVEPRIAFFGTDDPAIVGDPKNISIAKDILGSGTGSLKSFLQPLAFTVVGPASWYQNVCDDIVGALSFFQTWTHIDVRIALVPDAGISAATLNSLQNTWQSGIEGTWNNPVPNPGAAAKPWTCARTGEVPCRVSVKVHWVTSEPHHIVAVHAGSGSTDESNWYTSDPGSTAAHEFGHMLGLPDEYAQASCPGRAPVGTGTIMDINSSFIPQRMVQWIADEIGSDVQ